MTEADTDSGFADVTIAVIAALPSEYAAALEVLGPLTECKSLPCRMALAVSIGKVGIHRVAVVMLPELGKGVAAIVTSELPHMFPRLQHLIVSGIAAAVPCPSEPKKHVRLGDIVISEDVLEYDLVTIDGDAREEIRRPPCSASIELRRLARLVAENPDKPWETEIEQCLNKPGCPTSWARPSESCDVLQDSNPGEPVKHPEDSARCPNLPRVFMGRIGSGDRVVKNSGLRDLLGNKHGCLALEMESAGVALAAHCQEIKFIIVRGTCDYANRQKSDRWQIYAAVAAAAFVKCLILKTPMTKVQTSDATITVLPGIAENAAKQPHRPRHQESTEYYDEMQVVARDAINNIYKKLRNLELKAAIDDAKALKIWLEERKSNLAPTVLFDAYEALASVLKVHIEAVEGLRKKELLRELAIILSKMKDLT